MKIVPLCIECLHCKLILNWRYLICSKGYWVRNDGQERTIKLKDEEKKTIRINLRQLFFQAKKCADFENMTEEESE